MLRRLRLTFADVQTERAFKQGLEKRLLLSTCVACVVFCSGWTSHINDYKIEAANEENPFDFAGDDLRTHRLVIVTLIWLVLPGCFLLAATIHLRFSCFERVDWETFAVAIPTILCVTLPWTNRWTYVRLYGQDPDDVWARDMRQSHAVVVLMLDAVFTVFCLFVPIRIHLLWMPVILGCVSFVATVIGIGSPFPHHILWEVITILGLGLCALWGARNNEQVSRHSWFAQQGVRSKSVELVQQCTTNFRILERLCDCLVQLDERFSVVDPSPRFSALLFCSSTEILKGAKFCDYIDSDQDRRSFESALLKSALSAKSTATDTTAAMVQISLRDSWGRKFVVSVYHAVAYDMDGQCGHMLAIIEGQDRESPPNTTNFDSLALPLDSRLSGSITHSVGSTPDDFSDDSSSVAMSTGESEVAAWIDVSSPDLQILSCTTGFTQLRPISVGAGLCRFLVGGEGLRPWLQDCANAHEHGLLESTTSMPAYTLLLQPIPTVAMGYTAVLQPDFETSLPPSFTQQTEDSSQDCDFLRVVLSDLKYQPLKKKRFAARSKDRRRNKMGVGLSL